MKEKHNIDRYFQERFKDFEVEPDDQVWHNIESRLKEKKKRRIVPFWWKLGTAAAILVLGLFIFNNRSDSHLEYPTKIQSKESTIAGPDGGSIDGENVTPGKEVDNSQITHSNKTEVEERSDAINTGGPNSPMIRNNSVASSEKRSNRFTPVVAPNNRLSFENTSTVRERHDSKEFEKDGILDPNAGNDPDKMSNVIAENVTGKNIERITTETNNNNIIAETDNLILDSTAIATVVPNPLEELLNKNEKEKKTADTNLNRWQITSSVAPIYFSSASNGSPIDPQFSGNEKSYENNTSVGLGVNYAVSKRVQIRTAINRFKLGYNTNNVVFFAGLQSQHFDNITRSNTGANIEIVNSGDEAIGLQPFEAALQSTNDGAINQKMGYFEVPLEIAYKIIDKKIDVSVIGGVSTLFLNENSISVISQNMSASLGSANNLNEVHFSSNIGLGLNYNFWKSFNFHFEPIFKYQINTFTKDSGDFKPYFFGLYSGVSVNF